MYVCARVYVQCKIKQLPIYSHCFILDVSDPGSAVLYITDLVSLVHTPHSLSVQTSGPPSLVHTPHSLSVQTSYSVYPPPHILQLLAVVLVCLVLA